MVGSVARRRIPLQVLVEQAHAVARAVQPRHERRLVGSHAWAALLAKVEAPQSLARVHEGQVSVHAATAVIPACRCATLSLNPCLPHRRPRCHEQWCCDLLEGGRHRPLLGQRQPRQGGLREQRRGRGHQEEMPLAPPQLHDPLVKSTRLRSVRQPEVLQDVLPRAVALGAVALVMQPVAHNRRIDRGDAVAALRCSGAGGTAAGTPSPSAARRRGGNSRGGAAVQRREPVDVIDELRRSKVLEKAPVVLLPQEPRGVAQVDRLQLRAGVEEHACIARDDVVGALGHVFRGLPYVMHPWHLRHQALPPCPLRLCTQESVPTARRPSGQKLTAQQIHRQERGDAAE
mmetsp:Transcript_65498/g.213230  ORF Transcript_65498/g.213230 Transcript_65498/m.213230 type:complete len:345 (-) Transcript_65498:3032-4066(-)